MIGKLFPIAICAVGLLLAACTAAPPEPPPAAPAPPGAPIPAAETRTCGGVIGAQCDAGQYCAHPPENDCGRFDRIGICLPMPDVCTERYDPVCGCDGRTHGNACIAASNGVSVQHAGECAAGG